MKDYLLLIVELHQSKLGYGSIFFLFIIFSIDDIGINKVRRSNIIAAENTGFMNNYGNFGSTYKGNNILYIGAWEIDNVLIFCFHQAD